MTGMRTNFVSPIAQNAYSTWYNEAMKLENWEKTNLGPERDESMHQAWIKKVQNMEAQFHAIDTSEANKVEKTKQQPMSYQPNSNVGKTLDVVA